MKSRNLYIGISIIAIFALAAPICYFDMERDNPNDPYNIKGPIYMFGSSSTSDGILDIGGRDGADQICKDERPSDLPGSDVHAFISVNSDDEIRDMLYNYGVPKYVKITGPTGTIIANNWDDLLDGDILSTLYDAGVLPNPAGDQWWSGSNSNGGLELNNCNEWNSGTDQGVVGDGVSTNSSWINITTINCGLTRRIVCICW